MPARFKIGSAPEDETLIVEAPVFVPATTKDTVASGIKENVAGTVGVRTLADAVPVEVPAVYSGSPKIKATKVVDV